jgi:hypothetical protein
MAIRVFVQNEAAVETLRPPGFLTFCRSLRHRSGRAPVRGIGSCQNRPDGRCVENWKRTAEEKGAKLLVIIQPSAIDVTPGVTRLNAVYLSRFDEYRADRLTSVIDEICNRNQIDRINLFPLFVRNNPDSLYFKIDTHWNDAGQDLAARETASYIHTILKVRERN